MVAYRGDLENGYPHNFSSSGWIECKTNRMQWQNNLFFASLLFCVGRLNRIVVCIPVQSLTTAAGASSQNSYPVAQILTVNLKLTAGHPGSRAKSLAVFSGAAAWHRTWGGCPHKMYQVHQSCPHQLAKSLFFLLIFAVFWDSVCSRIPFSPDIIQAKILPLPQISRNHMFEIYSDRW